jgi:hypothetical protein
MFGTSPFAFDNPEPRDFIPHHEKVVPRTLQACGARFRGFDGMMTDGAEIAYFEIDAQPKAVAACIERQLPQGKVVEIERTAELERLLQVVRTR